MGSTISDRQFDAQAVSRSRTTEGGERLEMQFRDPQGRQIVVSLPAQAAVQLGCMICDVSQHAPYLIGGVTTARRQSL